MILHHLVSSRRVRQGMMVLLGSITLASSVAAQQGPGASMAGYKDPGTATLFSVLLTGGGQFYAGETKKGAVLLGLGLGSFIAGAALSTSSCDYYDGCSTNAAPLAIGALAYLGTWIYGIADAGAAARRQNAAHGFSTVGASPTMKTFANGRMGLGLSIKAGP